MAKKIEYIRRDDAIRYAQWEGAYKAVMYLEELKSEDVQPVDRWISVDDRLPDDCVEVLVYDTDCGIVIGWYDKEIGDFVAEFISPLDAVTHWLPLPEPPYDTTKG